MAIDSSVRRLRRIVSGLAHRRSTRRAAAAEREHEVGPAERAGLPDRADLRHVGLGGQTTHSGA